MTVRLIVQITTESGAIRAETEGNGVHIRSTGDIEKEVDTAKVLTALDKLEEALK